MDKVKSNPFFTNVLTSETEAKQRGILSGPDNEDLQSELDEVERRVKELRGARHSITVDLEWAEQEADRLRRHLAQNKREER